MVLTVRLQFIMSSNNCPRLIIKLWSFFSSISQSWLIITKRLECTRRTFPLCGHRILCVRKRWRKAVRWNTWDHRLSWLNSLYVMLIYFLIKTLRRRQSRNSLLAQNMEQEKEVIVIHQVCLIFLKR